MSYLASRLKSRNKLKKKMKKSVHIGPGQTKSSNLKYIDTLVTSLVLWVQVLQSEHFHGAWVDMQELNVIAVPQMVELILWNHFVFELVQQPLNMAMSDNFCELACLWCIYCTTSIEGISIMPIFNYQSKYWWNLCYVFQVKLKVCSRRVRGC